MAMHSGYYYVLCAKPLVLGSTGPLPRNGSISIKGQPLQEALRPYSLLQHFSWYTGREDTMAEILAAQQSGADMGIDYHAMVSSGAEDELRVKHGVAGCHTGHNIHVNERVFKPLGREKRYDAVYVAQLATFKRHELARGVRRLVVVSYGGNLHEFCPALRHAYFNHSGVPPWAVAETINAAGVGLCLSEEEGQMNASIEYLMCGIPVVTTPSRGGRDEYFDAHNSLTVPPEPEAVATAVEDWLRRAPDPIDVRRAALEKIARRRRSYCSYVAQVIHNRGGPVVDPDWLMVNYFGSDRGIQAREVLASQLRDSPAVSKFGLELPDDVPLSRAGVRARPSESGLELAGADGRALRCSGSAAVVWELCDGRSTLADIVAEVTATFSVPAAQAQTDVIAVLGALAEAGFVDNRTRH